MSAPNPSRPTQAPSGLVIGLCFALLSAIWGSTWIVIKGGLQDLPPFTSAAARFVVAWLIISLFAERVARREGGKRPGGRLVLAMGVCNFAVSYGIVYWSETVLPSSLVSLLWGTFPMMMAMAGHVFLAGEKLRIHQWLGFLVGFAGVAALFATDLADLEKGSIGAALILLLSPLVSTVGTILVKKEGEGVSSLLLNRDGMRLGALLLCLLAFLFERDEEIHWTGPAVASIAYLALMGTVVTFSLYFWLMRYARASRLSLIAYVTPPIAMALGALDGEPIGASTLVGAGLILMGVVLATREGLGREAGER